jgi:hypothetical protein
MRNARPRDEQAHPLQRVLISLIISNPDNFFIVGARIARPDLACSSMSVLSFVGDGLDRPAVRNARPKIQSQTPVNLN